MRFLSGLAELAPVYDGFIVDLWGVIHDGLAPYPGATDCLRRLAGKPVLLLSNAPRRAEAAREMLRVLGIGDDLYTDIVTSGEATWQALHDRSDPWFSRLGQRVYHLGPERDRSVLEGLELTRAARPEMSDLVLNTGPDDVRNPTDLADYVPELRSCLAAGLPMICANPDIEVVRGGVHVLCAGALAIFYEAEGGNVRWIGKPDPAIYDTALALIGLDRRRVLAVGDSLRTDIAGAAAAGIDSLWITGGIHADALGRHPARAGHAAGLAGVLPLAAMARFVW